MKFLALLALAVATSAFGQGSTNYVNAAGTVQSRQQVFLSVVNGASSAVTEGKFVCLDLTDDNGITVDFCAGEGDMPLCMVLDASCAVGARCKCLKEGFTDVASFDPTGGTGTAGGVGYAAVDGDIVVISSPGAADFPAAVFLDASASTGDVQVYLSL